MRSKIGLALAVLPLTFLTACGGGSSGPAVTEDGWQLLFDGSSIDHLNAVGDANWRIEDGSVIADQSSGASFLVTPDSYSDFELELEFWVNTEANSGVFLRCQDPTTISDTSCYEANIYDTRPDQTYRTGGIVNVAEPAEFVYTGGQWNRYEITANGNRLQVALNGRDLVDVEDSQFASGPIALQYGSGIVRFRNVRVRPL
ncbi:MAG: DUF1080 domain-containing protein [Gammaproteobacteria bacterium]|jgi:hypothetical protein